MRVMMKWTGRVGVFLLAMILTISPSLADWNDGEPFKWLQRPDLSPAGMDVQAMDPYILASDFLCTQTGPLTGIHIWGSWLGDLLPLEGPEQVGFVLSIHKDIPADQNPHGFYSMPGEVEWFRFFEPGQFTARVWAEGLEEGWLEPPDIYFPPGADTVCWQYNFDIPIEDAYFQQGSEDEPIVYWLDVQAIPLSPEATFGWKTTDSVWNDAAVWARGFEPFDGVWDPLRYPPQHPFLPGEPFDLAFVIQGEEVQNEMDFGDAPDSYRTTLAMDGARHAAQAGFCLGTLIDAEADGQPSADAKGDDNDNLADEDGILSGNDLIPGAFTTFFLRASAAGYLDGWIDFAGDGSFAEPGDRLWAASQPIAAGINSLSFPVPGSALPGTQSFARLRFSSQGGLNYYGPAPDGEVEDYDVDIGPHDDWKWNQWPDLGNTGIDVCVSDPCILADDFLCTETGYIEDIQIWGSWLYDIYPFGENLEGVFFALSFHEDIPASENPDGYSIPGELLWLEYFYPGDFDIEITAEGLMEGWMWPPDDYIWPGDEVCWSYKFHVSEGERFLQQGTPDDPVVYWLNVQAYPEDPYASFGWKTSYEHWNDDAVWGYGSEPFGGPWGELVYPPQHEFAGQSIDLAFRLGGTPVEFDYDFGDAPDPTYPTLRMSDGARHRVPANPALYFGSSIDIEADGQPSPGATRDDTSGIDDEDGIDFADWISPGGTGQVEVTLSMTGIVDAWIDFAGDGSWAQPEDHIFAGMPVPAGAHVFSFAVPETGIEGHDSFARFRVRSSAAPLGYFGEAVDGEVEDYMVYIQDDASGTEDQVPERFGLEQNLPNPFNPWTEIAFSVPAGGGEVRLEIFDPSGRRVAVLLDEHRDAGRHSVIWKGRDEAGRQLSSGIYHCLFSAGDFRETRKMVMLR